MKDSLLILTRSIFFGNDFVGARRRRLYEYSYLATLFYRFSKIVRSYKDR
jgi:hypothetical protein